MYLQVSTQLITSFLSNDVIVFMNLIILFLRNLFYLTFSFFCKVVVFFENSKNNKNAKNKTVTVVSMAQ